MKNQQISIIKVVLILCHLFCSDPICLDPIATERREKNKKELNPFFLKNPPKQQRSLTAGAQFAKNFHKSLSLHFKWNQGKSKLVPITWKLKAWDIESLKHWDISKVGIWGRSGWVQQWPCLFTQNLPFKRLFSSFWLKFSPSSGRVKPSSRNPNFKQSRFWVRIFLI